VTPVTDLAVHRKDLVVSTQGRSFWILDDITPLHQITEEVETAELWLFAPRTAYRGGNLGGARINYYISEPPEGGVQLEILDGTGGLVRSFESGDEGDLPLEAGMNTFIWDLRREAIERPAGVVHWAGGTPGRPIVPGSYQVRLSAGEWSQTRSLTVEIHPNLSTTVADFQAQDDLLVRIGERIEEIFDGITKIRDIKAQTDSIVERMEKAGMDSDAVAEAAEELNAELSEIEEQMTQVRSQSGQDPINFPPMLDNQFTNLYGYVIGSDYQPTDGAEERFEDLLPQLADLMTQLDGVISTDLAAFNNLLRGRNVPPVITAP
jgi:hypothetical protein